MSPQVNKVCKGAWINLHNISNIRHYLTEGQAKTVVPAYATSKLDGNNALLARNSVCPYIPNSADAECSSEGCYKNQET